MMTRTLSPLAALAFLLAACGEAAAPEGASAPEGAPGNPDDAPWAGIGASEAIEFTGTEPFWGGRTEGATLTYSTPENIPGETIAIERFAGRNGLSLSGELDGQPFDMAVTPGRCSDGMSDRTYPFTVTLEVRGEQRNGCAWTASRPYTGPEAP